LEAGSAPLAPSGGNNVLREEYDHYPHYPHLILYHSTTAMEKTVTTTTIINNSKPTMSELSATTTIPLDCLGESGDDDVGTMKQSIRVIRCRHEVDVQLIGSTIQDKHNTSLSRQVMVFQWNVTWWWWGCFVNRHHHPIYPRTLWYKQ